jgi:NAD(P)-dependent dehydrogenase (short-subunit alcohol dehydrogenase family)
MNYSRSEDSAQRTLASVGGHHLAVRGDVSDDAAVATLVATVGEAYGRLDALVNNAGPMSQTPGKAPVPSRSRLPSDLDRLPT